MAIKLKVRKKSGALEPFKVEKLERSLVGAGGTAGLALELVLNVAKDVAREVMSDFIASGRRIITTRAIRQRVITELEKRQPAMAKSYKTYRKAK